MSKKRAYNWSFILYPESMEQGAFDILEQTMIKIAISPLHDIDITETGEIKKEHYHVLLNFDTLKSFQQVEEITKLVNGTIPIQVQSLGGYYDYLTHENNKNKTKYNKEDITILNGFNTDVSNKGINISDYYEIIINNHIVNFADLIHYLFINNRNDLFNNIHRYAYALNLIFNNINFDRIKKELTNEIE